MTQSATVETLNTENVDHFVWFDPKTQTTRVKQKIPNVAALSDDALRAALRKHGADTEALDECETRADLIRLAKDEGFWDYKGDVVPANKKREYGALQTCGDSVAELLRQTDIHWLTEVATANDIKIERWAHCNYGQTVMNLGNVLRGKIRRGEYVIIGLAEWNIENA